MNQQQKKMYNTNPHIYKEQRVDKELDDILLFIFCVHDKYFHVVNLVGFFYLVLFDKDETMDDGLLEERNI